MHCFKIILNYGVFILYDNKITCYLSLIWSYQIFTSLVEENADLLEVLYSHWVAMNMNKHSGTKGYENRKKENIQKTATINIWITRQLYLNQYINLFTWGDKNILKPFWSWAIKLLRQPVNQCCWQLGTHFHWRLSVEPCFKGSICSILTYQETPWELLLCHVSSLLPTN